MLAPAGEGQFGENITMASWRTAMKKLGFADFVEVGLGGDMTAAFGGGGNGRRALRKVRK